MIGLMRLPCIVCTTAVSYKLHAIPSVCWERVGISYFNCPGVIVLVNVPTVHIMCTVLKHNAYCVEPSEGIVISQLELTHL